MCVALSINAAKMLIGFKPAMKDGKIGEAFVGCGVVCGGACMGGVLHGENSNLFPLSLLITAVMYGVQVSVSRLIALCFMIRSRMGIPMQI